MSGIIPGASPQPTSSSLDGHDTNWLNEVDGNFLAFLRMGGRFAPMALATAAVMMAMLAPGWLLNGTTRTEIGTWTTGTVTSTSSTIANVGRTGGVAQGQLVQAWGFVNVAGVNTWTSLFPAGTYVKTITTGAMGAASLVLSQNASASPVSLAVGNAWVVIGPGVGCVANGNSHGTTTLDGFDTGVLNNVFSGMTVTGGDAPANATVNTVNVAGGSITINGGSATGTHTGLAYTFGVPKPASNPRIDLVSVDGTTGALAWTKGTEAASPASPTLPSNGLPAAELYLTTSTVALTAQSNIIDCRALASGSPNGGGFGAETSIASAGTTDISTAAGHVALITGTTLINSFGGFSASLAAPIYITRFQRTRRPSAWLPIRSRAERAWRRPTKWCLAITPLRRRGNSHRRTASVFFLLPCRTSS
jgi:hypothetical protein